MRCEHDGHAKLIPDQYRIGSSFLLGLCSHIRPSASLERAVVSHPYDSLTMSGAAPVSTNDEYSNDIVARKHTKEKAKQL